MQWRWPTLSGRLRLSWRPPRRYRQSGGPQGRLVQLSGRQRHPRRLRRRAVRTASGWSTMASMRGRSGPTRSPATGRIGGAYYIARAMGRPICSTVTTDDLLAPWRWQKSEIDPAARRIRASSATVLTASGWGQGAPQGKTPALAGFLLGGVRLPRRTVPFRRLGAMRKATSRRSSSRISCWRATRPAWPSGSRSRCCRSIGRSRAGRASAPRPFSP